MMKYINRDFILEWGITATLIVGVAMTSFNIYPFNLWISLFGNLGWLYLGWAWRKWSLFFVQAVITIIYTAGLMMQF